MNRKIIFKKDNFLPSNIINNRKNDYKLIKADSKNYLNIRSAIFDIN